MVREASHGTNLTMKTMKTVLSFQIRITADRHRH